jgi:hypothetical protein
VLDDLLPRVALDGLAIAVLAFALFDRRHGRRELAVAIALVNVAVLVAVVVIAAAGVGLSVGLGLFALLSMVRLRSEAFSPVELAYVLVAIALALVCGLGAGGAPVTGLLVAVALGAVGLLDHPRLSRSVRPMTVTLDRLPADLGDLRAHLEARIGAEVVQARVTDVDEVRETTRVELRYVEGQADRAALPELR